jgi:hypothetical protein
MAAICRRSFFLSKNFSLLAALMISACSGDLAGWVPPGLGLNRLMALPQPFRPDSKTVPAASNWIAEGDVTLTGIVGLTPQDERRLAEAIAHSADAADILVLTPLEGRRTSLLEAAAAVTSTGSQRRIVLSLDWRHSDGTGTRYFSVETTDPRTAGPLATETIETLGHDIVGELAGIMGVSVPTPATSARAAHWPPKIYIAPATGAPGDGNRALPAALSAVLQGEGLPLARDRAHSDYTVTPIVTIAIGPTDTDDVSVDWHISSARGAGLGDIRQSNEMPKGVLDHGWGETAYDIASAAAEGLLEALERLQSPHGGAPNSASRPATSPVPSPGKR